MIITSLGLQTNKSNKRLLRATNSLISATKLIITTRIIANQKARIRMIMTIVMIIVITINKLMSLMYPETNL